MVVVVVVVVVFLDSLIVSALEHVKELVLVTSSVEESFRGPPTTKTKKERN